MHLRLLHQFVAIQVNLVLMESAVVTAIVGLVEGGLIHARNDVQGNAGGKHGSFALWGLHRFVMTNHGWLVNNIVDCLIAECNQLTALDMTSRLRRLARLRVG